MADDRLVYQFLEYRERHLQSAFPLSGLCGIGVVYCPVVGDRNDAAIVQKCVKSEGGECMQCQVAVIAYYAGNPRLVFINGYCFEYDERRIALDGFFVFIVQFAGQCCTSISLNELNRSLTVQSLGSPSMNCLKFDVIGLPCNNFHSVLPLERYSAYRDT